MSRGLFGFSVFFVLSMTLMAQAGVACSEMLQQDCFTVKVDTLKYDPQNTLHQKMSDGQNGRKVIQENLFAWKRFVVSEEAVSPNAKDIYIGVWSKKSLSNDSISAFVGNSKDEWKKTTFKNVTDTYEFPPFPLGKPMAIYHARTQGTDGRVAALVLPVEWFSMEAYMAIMLDAPVYPPELVFIKQAPNQATIYGFWLDNREIEDLYNRFRSVSFVGLFNE